jgi:hypothetical protein
MYNKTQHQRSRIHVIWNWRCGCVRITRCSAVNVARSNFFLTLMYCYVASTRWEQWVVIWRAISKWNWGFVADRATKYIIFHQSKSFNDERGSAKLKEKRGLIYIKRQRRSITLVDSSSSSTLLQKHSASSTCTEIHDSVHVLLL